MKKFKIKSKKKMAIASSFVLILLIGVVVLSAKQTNSNDTKKNSKDTTEKTEQEKFDELKNNDKVMENNIIVPLSNGSSVFATKEENINPDNVEDGQMVFFYTDDENDSNKHYLHTFHKIPDMTDNMVNIMNNKLHKYDKIHVIVAYTLDFADSDNIIRSDNYGLIYDVEAKSITYYPKLETDEIDNADAPNETYNVGDTISDIDFKIDEFDDAYAFLKSFASNVHLPFDFSDTKPMYVDSIENDYEFNNIDENAQNDYVSILNKLGQDLDIDTVETSSYITLNKYENIQDVFLSYMTNKWVITTKDGRHAILRATYSIG